MWKTLKEYAKEQGVTLQAIRNRIDRGKLKSKTDGKKIYVLVGEDDEQPTQPEALATQPTEQSIDEANAARARKWDAETDFKQQKILNLRADLILKRQKVTAYREKLRTEFCEGVLECYTDAFSDLKGVVVDLKLRKEQITKFKDTYKKCLKRFESKLIEYIKTKDSEEEREQDENTAV